MAKDVMQAITDGFADLRASLPAPVAKSYGVSTQNWITGADMLPSIANQVRKPYAQHGVVYRAMNANATAVSRFPLRVYPVGDRDVEIDDHWMTSLWARPDSLRRAGQLTFALSLYLDHWGEFLLHHRDVRRGGAWNLNRPWQIDLIYPGAYTEVVKCGELVAWNYDGPNGRSVLSLEEVTYYRDENPYDPIRGLGPLTAAYIEYTADYQAAQWNKSFLQNGSIPPIVFFATDKDTTWPNDDRKEFIESWQARAANPGTRGQAAALPVGIQAALLKTTQQEMDFFLGRTFNREQLLMILKVPPAIAGVPSSGAGNYQNFGQQRTQHHFGTVMPRKEAIESAITVDLVQRYEPDREAALDDSKITAEVTSEDFGRKVEMAQKLWSMGVPVAEMNDQLGLGIETDKYPWLALGWLPFSVTPADQAMAPPETGDPDGDPNEADPPADQGKHLRAAGGNEKARAAQWRGHERRMLSLERKLTGDWRKFLLWLRDKTLAGLDGLKAVRRDIVPPEDEAARQAVRVTEATIRLAVKTGWEQLLAEIGGGVEFEMSSPSVRTLLAERAQSIVGASETAMEKLRAAIADGVQAGESVPQIAQRVKDFITEQYRGQAVTVARTESAAAYSRARHESMAASGIAKHQWLSARDSLVRQSHTECDGEVRAFGETFPDGLTEPHQANADPGEVINCRCVAIPVVEG